MSENLVYKEIDTIAEYFIKNANWSNEATEREKTLVAGNIRGFVADLKARLNSCDACPLEQFYKCEDTGGGCIRKEEDTAASINERGYYGW